MDNLMIISIWIYLNLVLFLIVGIRLIRWASNKHSGSFGDDVISLRFGGSASSMLLFTGFLIVNVVMATMIVPEYICKLLIIYFAN